MNRMTTRWTANHPPGSAHDARVPVQTGRGLRRRRPPERRGTILILVVGVLVLLAIIATVYVGVGRLERTVSTAAEAQFFRGEVSSKVVDYIGKILAEDLFAEITYGPNQGEMAPFADGEDWDYPYTRPGTFFNDLADPWLASTEPLEVGVSNYIWPHISNIEPGGRFVDLNNLFGARDIYTDPLWITGGTPFDWDSYVSVPNEFEFNTQLDDLDIASDGYLTYADQRYGTDTDGDGHMDARWTELPEIYGLPQGMRTFVAARIIDGSSMINVNTSMEPGLIDGTTETYAGSGETPADIDLYGLLWDRTQVLNNRYGGSWTESDFLNEAFKRHLDALGAFAALEKPDTQYSLSQRFDPDERAELYDFARFPYRPYADARLYGSPEEIELRTFWGRPNAMSTSRLERSFDNLDTSNPLEHLDFRASGGNGSFFSYADDSPKNFVVMQDARRLLTTYNGSVPARPWSSAANPLAIGFRPNINEMLVGLEREANLQGITGAFYWALAPYAVDDDLTTNVGFNVYGTTPEWGTAATKLHYGDGSAAFAFIRSAMMAVNARDTYDSDAGANDKPSIQYVRIDNEPSTIPYRDGKEIYGEFEFGEIPVDSSGLRGTVLNLIGFERQPFFREVGTYIVYHDIDKLPTGNPNEYRIDTQVPYWSVFAFEIGNPWDEPLDLDNLEVQIGPNASADRTIDLVNDQTGTIVREIPAGGAVVFYVSDSAPGTAPTVREQWESHIQSQGGGHDVVYINKANFRVDQPVIDGETLLFRTNIPLVTLGGPERDAKVLIDRIRATNNGGFPNLMTFADNVTYTVPPLTPTFDAYVAHSASMRRYCAPNGANGGFPGYVFQSPDAITTGSGGISFDDNDSTPIVVTGSNTDPPADFVSRANVRTGYLNGTSQRKGYLAVPSLPAFQFHVHARETTSSSDVNEFMSPVDLLLVTSATHVNVPDNVTDPLAAVTDLQPDRWITVSEMLGDTNLANREPFISNPQLVEALRPAGQTTWPVLPDHVELVNGDENPFVGKLDYTRFIPRDAGGKTYQDDAIPLAARVPEAFETISVSSDAPLVQGRININTAPVSVLERLPYLDPRFAVAGFTPGMSELPELIEAYRDRLLLPGGVFDFSQDSRSAATNILTESGRFGLRDDYDSGINSVGELLLLTNWQQIGGPGGSYEPATGVPIDQSLVRFGHDGTDLQFEPIDPFPTSYGAPSYDASDDIAERLALVRAIKNSVATRSDVFYVYIKLIGVTPADVEEARQLASDLGGEELEYLTPTLEQRFIVGFDRSNVRRVTDRPRLIFALREVPTP
ncbi:MAG: hypothetical protein ACF8PN_13190 [Phycisphaerales bacterium]